MKVLIVEDDYYKLVQISAFIGQCLPGAELVTAKAVHSAKQKIREILPDLVILDMSLPSYDIGKQESGGLPETFGGRELLGYLDFLDCAAPVVVVTQFEKFGRDEEEMDLHTLGEALKTSYPANYRGIIFFQSASDAWKLELSRILREVMPSASATEGSNAGTK